MTVALDLSTLRLSLDEQELIGKLRARIVHYSHRNKRRNNYYEGKERALSLGMSIPPHMQDLVVSVGWPGTVVDVLEERLDFLGWTSTGDLLGLDDVYRDNQLAIESGRAHLEALITGTDFITVGKGDVSIGEPEVVVSVESASSATAIWDYRQRRLTAALSQTRDENNAIVMESLYLPNETLRLERIGTKMLIVDRDRHNLGRVPVARMVNRDRASDLSGRSEITRPVMYYTDAAARTMLGMEVNREFYTAPQRYALGAEPEQFGVTDESTEDERIMAGWKAAMGRLNVIPANEDGDLPQMGQFPSQPPTPYIEQVRAYSNSISGESGIPVGYFGFITENPPSADAIRQTEYRLVKRAERRQATFGQAWRDVAYLSILVRDGSVDRKAFRQLESKWLDASTPTRAASADEAQKLISSGVLPPDSGVTYDRVGLSVQDQARLTEDKRRASNRRVLDALPAAAAAATSNPAVAEAAARTTAVADADTQ